MDGIFYSEFDNIAGPKVTYQEPEGLLAPEIFDSISEYVITKPQLCGKVLGIRTNDAIVLGCPVCVEHPKYQRNALFFNLGFVFPSSMPTHATRPYRAIVKKLGALLYNMEIETEFLFRDESKKRLRECLGQIRDQLNQYRECAITIEGQEANPIFLRLEPQVDLRPLSSGVISGIAPPPTRRSLTVAAPHPQSSPLLDIKLDFVPIVVVPEIPVMRDWDLSLQFLVPLIDGSRTVQQIADDGMMDTEIVKNALHHLVYYGYIRITPPLYREDSYCVTPNIRELAFNTRMQLACIQFVALRPDERLPDFQTVFLLYSRMVPGVSVRTFIAEYDPVAHEVDVRRLIIFGVVNDLLYRIPHYLSKSSPPPISD